MRDRDPRGGLDGALAGLVLAAVPISLFAVFGLPWALVRSVALPLHGALWMAWFAWGWSALGLLRNVVTRVRRRDLTLSTTARATERLAMRLAALVLWTGSVLLPIVTPAADALPTPPTSVSGVQTISIPPAASRSYTVVEGDCLWTIANEHLGDPTRWIELARLNLGHTMVDGRLFLDPSLIFPGWQLELEAPPRTPVPQAGRRHATRDLSPSSPVTTTPGDAAPRATAPGADRATAPGAARSTALSASRQFGLSDLLLPSSLGAGAVMIGLALRRRRRQRPAVVSEQVIDLDLDLERSGLLVATRILERACVLADRDGILDGAFLLEINEDGARLFRDGRSFWSALPSDLDHPIEFERAPGLVLPLGDTEGRSWALVIARGSTHAIAGPHAERVIDDGMKLQAEFCWGPLLGQIHEGKNYRGLDLDGTNELAQLATVVCGETGDIWIGEHGLEIGSLGIEAPRAQLSEAVRSLLEDESTIPEQGLLRDTARGTPAVVVRLLCPLPHIEGLEAELEPKRARRATEVVSYLALNRPGPITGDRLRTRVLGSAETDAAAKTLFNVASAARRSLGLDAHGIARLPGATRLGQYRLSDEVGTDLDLMARHLQKAEQASEEEVEMVHLRAALELIEGEPMATVLSGWEWFAAEGHRARLERAVETAALRLIELSINYGHFALGDLGLQQARFVVPYSEALAEAAMNLAAHRGDISGLRRAYEDFGSVVEALDPGSWPIEAVEDRYRGLLSQAQASFAAIEAAPRSTSPSAPAAL